MRRLYRNIVFQDDEKWPFSATRAEQFAEYNSANNIVEKNAPMGEPMVPPWIPPPSDARIAGGPGLKDSYFYSNEVSTTRTGEKVT